jgi:hypothetical protein
MFTVLTVTEGNLNEDDDFTELLDTAELLNFAELLDAAELLDNFAEL